MWFNTSSLGHEAHLHPGNCQLRFCCSTTAGPAVGTCLFHSRNPALRNGTELHTRDKLMQQQWHETVLFFHYYHHTRLPLSTLTSFIPGCHEQSLVKEGCEDSVEHHNKPVKEWQPQRIQLGKLNLEACLGQWAKGEHGEKPTPCLLPLRRASW